MSKKPYMALFFLFLILSLSYVASATGEGTIKVIGKDGTVQSGRVESQSNVSTKSQSNVNSSNNNTNNNVSSSLNQNTEENGVENSIKGVQTAIEGSFKGIGTWIVSQFMAGSVDIYATPAQISVNESRNLTTEKLSEQFIKEGKAVEDTNSKTITYQVNYKIIDPFAPTFTKQFLLYSGGLYIFEIFLVILSSFVVFMWASDYPESYYDFVHYYSGEEKPYTYKMMTINTIIALSYWIIALIIIFSVTGPKNLLIATMSGHEVTLPMMYINDFATQMLTAASSYIAAFQTAMAEFGIYIIATLIFVSASITDICLVFGSYKKAITINKIIWGTYVICNIADLIIVGLISAGVGIYHLTDNPIFVTVGVVSAALINFVILASMILFAILAGKQIIINKLNSNNLLPFGGL